MTSPVDDDYARWGRVVRAMRLTEALLDRDMHDADLQVTEYEVLDALSDASEGWMRMSTLADAVVQSRSRLTHTATRLEKRGWVRRRPSKDDRRGIELALSDAGRARFDEVRTRHLARLNDLVLRHLSSDELELWDQTCARLIEANEPLIGPRGV